MSRESRLLVGILRRPSDSDVWRSVAVKVFDGG
jgi:hypothetical protein